MEDIWSVTPNLVLNLGLRADKFDNKLASGATFAKADFGDMISPRVGFSWDMKGDGTTKLFGNAGRYYIPLTNKLADYFGGGTTDEHTYYVLDGWTEMNHPVTGTHLPARSSAQQIGPVNTTETSRHLTTSAPQSLGTWSRSSRTNSSWASSRPSTRHGPMASMPPTAR